MPFFRTEPAEKLGDVGCWSYSQLVLGAVLLAVQQVRPEWLSWLSPWWFLLFLPTFAILMVCDLSQTKGGEEEARVYPWWNVVRRAVWQICSPLSTITTFAFGAVLVVVAAVAVLLAMVWLYQVISIKALLFVIAIVLVLHLLLRRR